MFGDKPSIADLSLACELSQLEAIGFMTELEKQFPSIHHWLYVNMMGIPGYKAIHDKGMLSLKRYVSLLEKQQK